MIGLTIDLHVVGTQDSKVCDSPFVSGHLSQPGLRPTYLPPPKRLPDVDSGPTWWAAPQRQPRIHDGGDPMTPDRHWGPSSIKTR